MQEKAPNKEKNKDITTNLPFLIVRPGGNDTGLFIGETPPASERKRLNGLILQMYPNVEQVGFLDSNFYQPKFTMAGGEFCGNGTRSAAFILLGGQPGELLIETSGVEGQLRTGIRENGESYAQMPIYADPGKIQQAGNMYIVEMEGITHLVTFVPQPIQDLQPEGIKKLAMQEIMSRGFDQKYPAAGVIYVSPNKEGLKIDPVVYVRDVETSYYETACGSGTTAVGLVLAKQNAHSILQVPITQPSGMDIKISVEYNKDNKKFGYAEIQGPINLLAQGVIETSGKNQYALEQITAPCQLEQAFQLGLLQAYKEAFAAPPYYEDMNGKENDIRTDFRYYFENGIVCTAKTEKGIIGFAAALPLQNENKIVNLLADTSIDPQSYWYIAELGINNEAQGKGMGRKLMQELLLYPPIEKNFILRTSVENFRAISLYQSLGFSQIEGVLQEVEQLRTDGSIQKDTRLFLVKN